MTPDLVMTNTARFEPPESFVDPRTEHGFQSCHWPCCDEKEAPPMGTPDRHERRCIEFLAAYYQINCRQAELAAAREASAPPKEIRKRLAAVEAALEELDCLEDRYAPVGFYGEPKMNGVYYRDIRFCRPELPRILPEASSLSSHLAIPGIAELPEGELTGPVVITRWTHGKVDF
jgi:hypothetical protein